MSSVSSFDGHPNYILVALYQIAKQLDSVQMYPNDPDARRWRQLAGMYRASIFAGAQSKLEADLQWTGPNVTLDERSLMTGSLLLQAASKELRTSIKAISTDTIPQYMFVPISQWDATNAEQVKQRTHAVKQFIVMSELYETSKRYDTSSLLVEQVGEKWKNMKPIGRYNVMMASKNAVMRDWAPFTLVEKQGNMVMNDNDIPSLVRLAFETLDLYIDEVAEGPAGPTAYKLRLPSIGAVSDDGQPGVNSMDGIGPGSASDSGSEQAVRVDNPRIRDWTANVE